MNQEFQKHKPKFFEFIGPKQIGILDQFVIVGAKWKTNRGLYGDAVSISDDMLTDAAKNSLMIFATKQNRRHQSSSGFLWVQYSKAIGEIYTLRKKNQDLSASLESVRKKWWYKLITFFLGVPT